jgi:hypothetical protein
MAFGSIRQAWREKAFYVENPETLHVADPAHDEDQGDPNKTWGAPAEVNNQPDYLYADDAVVGDYFAADGGGMFIDSTPNDHQDGGEFEVTKLDSIETIEAAARTGGRSYGADRMDVFAVPPMQDATTRYLSNRIEGVGFAGVAPTALVRGLNANPENNPEGFRRGWVEQSFVDRKFYEGQRFHDRRLLTPNVATIADDQPPVEGTSGSPFRGLQRAFSSVSQNPMIRREPPSMSESVTTDGTEQTYDMQPSDWVTG